MSVRFLLLVFAYVLAVVKGQLSDGEKQDILAAHNSLRANVDPTASDMEQMVWNDELAEIAQNYADTCNFIHNQQRSEQSSSFATVGENLGTTTSPQDDYVALVQAWYDEVQDFTHGTGCADSKVCGHYTQVVWANSRDVGCGATRCSTLGNTPGPFMNALFLVCNYGPSGNFADQLHVPYAAGESCSACPTDLPFCSNNLCSASAATVSDTGPNVTESSGPTTTESNDHATTTDGESSDPTATESSDPTATESSDPTATESSDPTTTESSDPTTTESSDPTATESSDPTTTESSDPTATESSDPTTTESSDPTTTESSDPTTTESSDPTTTEQSDPASHESSNLATTTEGGTAVMLSPLMLFLTITTVLI